MRVKLTFNLRTKTASKTGWENNHSIIYTEYVLLLLQLMWKCSKKNISTVTAFFNAAAKVPYVQLNFKGDYVHNNH